MLIEILQQTINGLAIGGVYVLIALGLTTVFGILGIAHFAHGSISMSGGYITFFLVTGQGLPLLAAIPADRRVDLIGRFDLAGVAACLARAALYVGNDSGLMHMAAAMGTPTLGLFGPSHATLYGPWGPLTAFVRTDLSYDEIMYSPGYNYRTQVSHMDTLPVARVTAAAEALLARAAAHRAA